MSEPISRVHRDEVTMTSDDSTTDAITAPEITAQPAEATVTPVAKLRLSRPHVLVQRTMEGLTPTRSH